MPDHSDELDALVEPLEAAGLVEQYTNDDGKEAMRLTRAGEQARDAEA